MTHKTVGDNCICHSCEPMYRAGDLPAGTIVRATWGAEYERCQNIPSVMRWGQPIPGSEDWMVALATR